MTTENWQSVKSINSQRLNKEWSIKSLYFIFFFYSRRVVYLSFFIAILKYVILFELEPITNK